MKILTAGKITRKGVVKRIFVAIDISDEAKRTVEARIAAMRGDEPRWAISWTLPEKLHLTLRFIGDVDGRQLAAITESVKRAAEEVSPFTPALTGSGVFPSPKKPRILWIGVRDDSGACIKLKQSLDDYLQRLGFAGERNVFTPHLTIARIKDARRCRDLVERHLADDFQPVEFPVSWIAVYESKLLPAGSVYSKISGFALKKADNC